MTNQRRETVWTWLQGLDARQISRAVDEVHKVVQGRVFEAMTTGRTSTTNSWRASSSERGSESKHKNRPVLRCSAGRAQRGLTSDRQENQHVRFSVCAVRGARLVVSSIGRATTSSTRLTTPRPVRSKLDAPGWLPVRMRDGETRRKSANVSEVWALVCDLDDGLDGWDSLVERVEATGRRAILHTTWSHTPEAPRARVVFPLDEAVSAEKWAEVWESGAAWASSWGAVVDGKCKDPARL